MTNSIGFKVLALGLTAASGLGIAFYPYFSSDGDYEEVTADPALIDQASDYDVDGDVETLTLEDGTQTVAVPELEETAAATTPARTLVAAGDPTLRALLRNRTVRDALALVGPDLIADPQIRRALRTGRVSPNIMSNPTVSRALMTVGPSLMADPQVMRAVRSGRFTPETLLRDPAVRSMLLSLDGATDDIRPLRTRHLYRGYRGRGFERAPFRGARDGVTGAFGTVSGVALDLTGMR